MAHGKLTHVSIRRVQQIFAARVIFALCAYVSGPTLIGSVQVEKERIGLRFNLIDVCRCGGLPCSVMKIGLHWTTLTASITSGSILGVVLAGFPTDTMVEVV